MEDHLTETAKEQLRRFCRQYLQLHHHTDIEFPSPEHLRTSSFQDCIYAKLYQEGAVKYSPPQRYQLRALKELTRRIEASITDWEEDGISDDLMNSLSSLLSSPIQPEATGSQVKSYVTYTVSALDTPTEREHATITLLESRNILSAGGVTGFRTWEAAMHLGNYLCANQSLVQGKHILELGTGTGYLSILCAKYLQAAHVIATDGSDDVVSSLSTNFHLNDLEDRNMEGKELKWGHALIGSEHPQWNSGRPIDLVVASDVTYDGIHVALVATFVELFDLYPNLKILIGSTVRNEATYELFLTRCQNNKLSIEHVKYDMVELKDQDGPFFPVLAPVKLCFITRTKP
ncbi:putative methyltransferase-domain-containing protein [Calycina marina]|uniref:Methyltransferase-domain-containing protein n=1 Tax=Calycina marina TaxID=1763456 RepID=A0A9P7ZB55_9HELO|nr:putative methyltransferase-domain-containing protein [Calycina marina]